MGDDLDSLGNKLLSNIDAEFASDPNINEYDVLPVSDSSTNRNPIIVINHKLAIEAWAARLLFCSASNDLRLWCLRNRRPNSATDSDWLCSVTRAVLMVTADHMTAWNVRKELIRSGRLLVEDDLRLSELILTKHPKSSETFTQRQWVLSYECARSQVSQCCPTSAPDLPPLHLFQVADSSRSFHHTSSHSDTDRVSSVPSCLPFTLTSQSPSSRTFPSHSTERHSLARHELDVCHGAADRYHSNYYAWTHRAWVLKHFTCCQYEIVVDELSKMAAFVDTHVSDHSGFHYRQILLDLLSIFKETARPVQHGVVDDITASIEDEDVMVTTCHKDLCKIFDDELQLTTDLITRYPTHEAIWYHRRYVIHNLLRMSTTTHQSHQSDDLSDTCRTVLCSDVLTPSKKTKLDSPSPSQHGESDQIIGAGRISATLKTETATLNCKEQYSYEHEFCATLLAACSSDASWEATLIHRHLRWLDKNAKHSY